MTNTKGEFDHPIELITVDATGCLRQSCPNMASANMYLGGIEIDEQTANIEIDGIIIDRLDGELQISGQFLYARTDDGIWKPQFLEYWLEGAYHGFGFLDSPNGTKPYPVPYTLPN